MTKERVFEPDELYLRGRLQVETARRALGCTGINPDAEQRLQTLLDVHDELGDPKSQNDPSLYLQGGTAMKDKADIIASLGALQDNRDATFETRFAAAVLREIM